MKLVDIAVIADVCSEQEIFRNSKTTLTSPENVGSEKPGGEPEKDTLLLLVLVHRQKLLLLCME